jgi:tripartite-type tricarboxylate transporter receptor subunit TctC
MRRIFLAGLMTAGFVSITIDARAQVYPSRPVTMIVPWPAGGPSDGPARILAERMRLALGRPVIVENVSGASGSAGTGRVARATPDGHTIVYGNLSTHVLNGAAFNLPYDVKRDFEPISLLASQSFLIAAKKALPAKNLRELIAWLKANPNKAVQGTGGPGGVPHLAGLLFQKQTGTSFGLVPYRGTALAINDLIAGHLDLMIDTTNNTLPHVRTGKIKAFAITAKSRLMAATDIPTVDEAGLPGFHVSSWQAVFAPKGVPQNVVARLNSAVVEALADPSLRQRFVNFGQQIFPPEQQTPTALAQLHAAEIERWWPIIKAANIRTE